MADKTTPIPLVENLSAPEVFASEAFFFSTSPGLVTITLTSFRFDISVEPEPAVQKRVVIGRLVMPTSGAQGLAVGLYDFLKKSGLDPAPPPTDPQQLP
jgi:hypothetical protein